MKKIFKEFKQFITRGNVIDLAVGMIIGAAFTAIVTAVVNNIFKPIINMIPLGDLSGAGLITMLVPKDANGVVVERGSALIDLTQSVYIDWGAFIMAVINFLLTAIILFIIIKAINSLRDGAKQYQITNLEKSEIRELKAQGMSRKQIKAYAEKKAADAAAQAAAEAEANKPETTEDVLKDIRELLRALQDKQSDDNK